MRNFDDFDTQRQADEHEWEEEFWAYENEWEEEFWAWYQSQLSPYKVYEVQGSKDLIYEWTK